MVARMTVIVSVLIGAPLLMGCQNKSEGGGNARVSATAAPAPTAAPQGSLRLVAGMAPLQYLLASGGVVRVLDVTASEQLLKEALAPQTVIRIDPQTGLSVGGQNIIPGPLPRGHRYEIWLDRQ